MNYVFGNGRDAQETGAAEGGGCFSVFSMKAEPFPLEEIGSFLFRKFQGRQGGKDGMEVGNHRSFRILFNFSQCPGVFQGKGAHFRSDKGAHGEEAARFFSQIPPQGADVGAGGAGDGHGKEGRRDFCDFQLIMVTGRAGSSTFFPSLASL